MEVRLPFPNIALKGSTLTHRRNLGIVIGFMLGLMAAYLAAAEFISAKKSKGEVLVFRRGHAPAALVKHVPGDEEAAAHRAAQMEKVASTVAAIIEKQTAIFQWQDVCYDIKIKKEQRRILDHVDGWVKPGTLTALMVGSSSITSLILDLTDRF